MPLHEITLDRIISYLNDLRVPKNVEDKIFRYMYGDYIGIAKDFIKSRNKKFELLQDFKFPLRMPEYKEEIFQSFNKNHSNYLDWKKQQYEEITNKGKYKEIANQASIYFQQAYEFLITSKSMDMNTAPLLEYYAMIQIVKACTIIQFDIPLKSDIFRYHGLTLQNSGYKIKNGVYYEFLAVITTQIGYEKSFVEPLETIKTKNLEDLISGYTDELRIDRLNIQFSPELAESFVVSWMLSTYVRYKPFEWTEIQQRVVSSIIMNVGKFRTHIFPQAIYWLLFPLLSSIEQERSRNKW